MKLLLVKIKNIIPLLIDMYLCTVPGDGFIWTTHKTSKGLRSAPVCEIDNLSGIIKIKSFANEKETKKIYSFASHMVNMHNKLSVVFEDLFNLYVKECLKYELEKRN